MSKPLENEVTESGPAAAEREAPALPGTRAEHPEPHTEAHTAEAHTADPGKDGDGGGWGIWVVVVFALAVAAVAAASRRRPERSVGSPGREAAFDREPAQHEPYSEASYMAALRAIEGHLQDWRTYALRSEGVRRSYTLSQLNELLAMGSSDVSLPVLKLESPQGYWNAGELELVVNAVLDELVLHDFPAETDPHNRASKACQLVAELEARERCDEFERHRSA